MTDKKYILLEVDATRHDELLEALLKRNFIRHVVLTTQDDRSKFETCPACERKFARESTVIPTDEMIEALLRVLVKMKLSKTVVFFNAKCPLDQLRIIDTERAVEFQHYLIPKAENLGLIARFVDGTQDTWYVTKKAIDFLTGKEPLSPCKLVTAEGILLSSSGSMMVEEVKSKDKIRLHRLLTECKDAVKDLSAATMKFIESGQMTLLG